MPLASDPHPQFERPPLAEATIGFRFARRPESWDSVFFGTLLARFGDYEFQDTLVGHLVQFDEKQVLSIGSAPDVKRFRSPDGGRVVLCGPYELSVSFVPRLMPSGYPSGTALRDEAARLYTAYTDVTKPDALAQVGVRYINNLVLAPPARRIGDLVSDEGDLVPRSVLNRASPAAVRTELLVDETDDWEQREILTVATVRQAVPSAPPVLVVDIDEVRTARRVTPNKLGADVPTSCAALQERVYNLFLRVFRPEVYDSFGPRAAAPPSPAFAS